MASHHYRDFVPAPGTARVQNVSAREHAEQRLSVPGRREVFASWDRLAETPFVGVTADGSVTPDLFDLRPNGAPVGQMVAGAVALLAILNEEQRRALIQPVDSHLWRRWQNTEIWVERHGLRLAECSGDVRAGVLAIVAASLSAQGYEQTRAVMRLNAFLGALVGAPDVLGEWSFTFVLYGSPHAVEPWGWQLFGHHLALHCVVVAGQLVLTPTFLGAEPTHADVGPFAGTRLFEDEERDGVALIRSLSGMQQARAILSHDIMARDLPPGRRHPSENLNLLGAFQDNRVVPCEGLPAAEMDAAQRARLLALAGRYVDNLPAGPRTARMDEIERHLDATHFVWIGATDDERPFYYRIQSRVIAIEFDHHIGVFLTNAEPQRFHVHTIVRTPNGNDYGMDVLRRHYETSHRG